MVVQTPRKRYEYEKARLLRKQGLSYNELKIKLGISKSTASLWCRDIKLSLHKQSRLRARANNMLFYKLGSKANHDNRVKEISIIKEESKKEINKLDLNSLKIAGAILYWAEGSKTKNTSISNSDPKMIEFALSWLRNAFNIKPQQIKAHLHIHYGNDELKIKKFWSDLTGIPLINFGKSFIKPKGTGHRTHILPNGIIKIRVAGIGTENLRHRILAWSEKIYELSKLI